MSEGFGKILGGTFYPYIYVRVSANPLEKCISIYDIPINEVIIINGEQKEAKNVKLGDNITFFYKNFRGIQEEKTFVVLGTDLSVFASTCFTGDSVVQTPLGSKEVSSLLIGDKVLCGDGLFHPIQVILFTQTPNQISMRKHSDGLTITDYHPVRIGSEWKFPIDIDLFESSTMDIDGVYSIGVSGASSIMINGIEVIGLGHGICNDPVASHPYFGTSRVIANIYELAPDGYCRINPNQIIRDQDTGLISRII